MPKEAKVVFLGSQGSGKTELYNKFTNTHGFGSTYQPTIGVDWAFNSRDSYKLKFHDFAGENPLASWYKDSNVAIYCVDLSIPLEDKDKKKVTADLANYRNHSPAANAKIILVGTKADLPQQVSDEQFDELFNDPNYGFSHGFKVSTKESLNTAELLNQLYDLVKKMYPEEVSVSDKAYAFFTEENPKAKINPFWTMSACEVFGWFCLPVLGWAYLAYYFISTGSSCYSTADAGLAPETDSMSMGS